MRNQLLDALKKSHADYAEIRFETDEVTRLSIRKDEIDSTEVSSFAGGIVRACKNGGWGTVIFDSPETMPNAVLEACECAAFVGKEKTELAEVDIVDIEVRKPLDHDFRGVDLQTKINIITAYNEIIIKTDPAIASSNVSYDDRMRTVYFANTHGSYFMEERPGVRVAFGATAKAGTLIQRTHEKATSTTTFDAILGQEEKVEAIAKRAVALLRAPKCDGGSQMVILDPKLGGVFIHEAFGHLSEADFLYENPKLKAMMTIGEKIGVDNLNVIDDGTYQIHSGTLTYDEEGTPARKKYLIKDGILTSHLHSRETAAKMGEEATGNARAQARNLPPLVRMTNTFIEPGTATQDDLFKNVGKGLYACSCFGGQTQFEMFTFSAAYGYRIENGQVGELVRDVVLTGNVFETMKNIDGIANDFDMIAGTCGKGGQGVPVGTGSPHVRINNVIVGGQ